MSFIKIQKINPYEINNPEAGHVYLGQDQYGLWELDEFGNVFYIQSGNTYITIIQDATTSGTSGVHGTFGTSGKDGSPGTAGTSGKSGLAGTSGSSGGIGISGTSGSSGIGISGSSGTSGKGSSGSSGKDGNFLGSSGTSGYDGGYGAATRVWKFSTLSSPPINSFCAGNDTYPGNYSLSLVNKIKINTTDLDNQLVDNWLNTWITGTLKIEDKLDASVFGIYSLSSAYNTKPVITYNLISGFTMLSSNGDLINNREYFISFVSNGSGSITSGSSGTSGTSAGSGIIDIVYDDIENLVTSNSLLVGTTYKITDYKTIYYNVILSIGLTGETIECDIEPLLVTASSINTFSPQVYSVDFPNDIIYYDWNPDNFLTNLNFSKDGIIISGFTGVIMYREDIINNIKVGCDFRNVKMKLWNIAQPDYISQIYSGGTFVTYNGKIYLSTTTTSNPPLDSGGTSSADWFLIINVENSSYLSFSDSSFDIFFLSTYLGVGLLPILDSEDYILKKIVGDNCGNINIGIMNNQFITMPNILIGNLCNGIYISDLCREIFINDTSVQIEVKSNSDKIFIHNYCRGLVIGDTSTNIFFEELCSKIEISNFATNIYFRNSCDNMKILSNCSNFYFGDNCDYQFFGVGCSGIVLGSACGYIMFGNSCYDIVLPSGSTANTFEPQTTGDLTNSTHILANYNCTIFRNANDECRLSYFNSTDILTVVGLNV